MKIAFVILHYQTIKETNECVQSIIDNIETNDFYIVIVDNGSPNGTGDILENSFALHPNVGVVKNSTNLGFARGHNSGIYYLTEKYDIDFIVLLNNDTKIIGKNWIETIEQKYDLYRFGVLGPDIILPSCEKHANPMKRRVDNINDLKREINRRKRLLIGNYLYINSTIYALKKIIKSMLKYQTKYPPKIERDETNVQLQGSCFILSKEYFKHYRGLFDKTFLYFEEEILRYLCERDNVKMVYTPDIVLLHKESISTKELLQNIRKKNIFFLKNLLRSCHEFKKLLNNKQDE